MIAALFRQCCAFLHHVWGSGVRPTESPPNQQLKNNMLLEEQKGPMGEQRLLDLVRASQASDFVPEQERNFDMGISPAHTSPYVYRRTEVIDGKTYHVYS